jgi:hypothetical protein
MFVLVEILARNSSMDYLVKSYKKIYLSANDCFLFFSFKRRFKMKIKNNLHGVEITETVITR